MKVQKARGANGKVHGQIAAEECLPVCLMLLPQTPLVIVAAFHIGAIPAECRRRRRRRGVI